VTVEESADTIYLVLPGTPPAGVEGGELSDKDLESVSGGSTWLEGDQCTSGVCQDTNHWPC